MFKIIKENKVLGIVSNPTWVRMQDNGCYGLTIEDNAQGIALNGTVYHVNGKPDLNGAETVSIEEVDDGIYVNSLTALLSDPNDLRNSEQFRKAVQMFAGSLDEDSAMVVATIYDPYQVDHTYAVGDYFTYGVNNVGDPQLYKVVQAHTSQADWKPDQLPAPHRNYTSFSYRFVVSRHRQISPQKPLSSLKSPACFEKKHEPINSG